MPINEQHVSYENAGYLSELTRELDIVYYDSPICSIVSDIFGHKFISHFVQEDGVNEIWYTVPTNKEILRRLLTGRFPLINALHSNSEKGFLAKVSNRSETKFLLSEISRYDDIGSILEHLPNDRMIFDEDEFSDYLSEELEPLLQTAQQNHAEIIDLVLTDRTIAGFPVDQLANIASTAQRLITNLAHHRLDPDSLGQRGRTSLTTESLSKMALTELMAGSVKLRLETIQQPDLITTEYDAVYTGINEFSQLIGIADVEALCEKLKDYPPRIRTNFLAFASSAIKAKTGIKVQTASSAKQVETTSTWDFLKVTEIVDKVSSSTISNENEHVFLGIFTEGKIEKSSFTFYSLEYDRNISGKLSSDLNPQSITLSKRDSSVKVLYSVTVLEKVTTKEDGTTNYEYTFLDIDKQ